MFKRDGCKPTKEGEILALVRIILNNVVSRGEAGETVLLNLLGVGTDWLTVHPTVKRDANAAYDGTVAGLLQ